MHIAQICILIACTLPIVCAALAKWRGLGKASTQGGYDHHQPRQWLAQLQGWQARANAAQQNSFETLPVFVAAVLVAQHNQATLSTVDMLAVAFVLLRIGYIFAYLKDFATLRSVLWLLAFLCCVSLFFVS